MRKKIILVTNAFPYGSGEQFVLDELTVLGNLHDVSIIPLYSNQDEIFYLLPSNVKVFKPICSFDIKDKRRLLYKGIFNVSPVLFSIKEFFLKGVFLDLNHLRNWISTTLIVRIVYANFKSTEIYSALRHADIIYFYWGDTAANSIPLLKSEISDKKVLVRFHGSDLYEKVKNNYIPFRNSLLKSIDFALFISDNGAAYLKNRYQKIDFKARVFRLGVFDHGISKTSEDGILRIVSCSALVVIKRIELIINALINISDINIEWTHLGDGPLRNELIELSKRLPANIKCVFSGNLPRQDLLKFYQENQVDLFINVSKSEGVPVSIMEAISFGIPVIATNVGGTSEIVNDSLGYLVGENITPNELALIIKNFFQRKDKHSLCLNSKRMYNEKYNASINYAKFNTFIEQIDDL